MDGAVLIQLIAAIGGSTAIASIITWLSSRRKNSAEVAEIWNRLTKDALDRSELVIKKQERKIDLQKSRYDNLSAFCGEIINDLEALGTDVKTHRAKLHTIEKMRTS